MVEDEVYESIERLREEVIRLGDTYYHWKAIHNIASKLNAKTIQTHSGFWATTLYSVQNTYVLGLSKLYDKRKDAFTIDHVLDVCKTYKGYFDNKHLGERKNPEYAAGKFAPSEVDFDRLAESCDESRKIVLDHIHPLRHNVVAHTSQKVSGTDITDMYGEVDTDSIELVISSAFTLGQSLWGCWENGHEFHTEIRTYQAYPSLEGDLEDLLRKASQ